jgi:hypothetical protein
MAGRGNAKTNNPEICGTEVGAKNEALFSGRVPHVRPSVHGPKTDFQMLSVYCARIFPLGPGVFVLVIEALEGAAPHLSRPMYAEANMGHPSCYFRPAVGSLVAGEGLWYPTSYPSRTKDRRCEVQSTRALSSNVAEPAGSPFLARGK